MITLIIALHIIICSLLIAIILIQSGRGGGLVDAFSGVESMFGTKTNAFLTRSTTVLSIAFFITCLSLALFSAKQSKSLMRKVKPAPTTASQDAPTQAQTQTEPESQAKTPTQDSSQQEKEAQK